MSMIECQTSEILEIKKKMFEIGCFNDSNNVHILDVLAVICQILQSLWHLRTDFVSYFFCHSLSLNLSHSDFAMFNL